ncbi:unnamed protein product [Pseudo-nitzschia multistriata]|uniref:TFIIS central domain-containing protein n=1 Tax=Pseudo-nitzschia multistriata TaxID=183589 RepID=A0A448ZBM5_9STRA|nr:unnamed protein product [Pseudo-nitzschia multistriata]
METKVKRSTELSAVDYRKWALNLVGRDWEIFWQEEQDGIEEDAGQQLENPHIASAALGATTLSEQEATEYKKKETIEDPRTISNSTDKPEGTIRSRSSGIASRPCHIDSDHDGDFVLSSEAAMGMVGDKMGPASKENEEIIKVEEKDRKVTCNTDADDEESVIDDWYDGRVLEIIDDTSTIRTIGRNGWKFRVRFLGDEDVYEIFLVPGKVRPSARAWVQRTMALLNPPAAASKEYNMEEDGFDLPPDTSTLEDEASLRKIKSKITGAASVLNGIDTENSKSLASLPTNWDFRRIQGLRYHLESQIHLRKKLSKIENHSGMELFTDGLRNPTEGYVNYLVQCSKDLAQACSWYCKSWNLLMYYFGDGMDGSGDFDTSTPNNNDSNGGETEETLDLGKLTFSGFMTDYIMCGKDTIVNTTMIDITSSGASNKRQQATARASSTRRTKRRRKVLGGMDIDEEIDEGKSKVLLAASKVDTDVLSMIYIDSFIAALSESMHYGYVTTLASMLWSLSHLVANPLISWKRTAGRILGGINNNGNDTDHSVLGGGFGNITGHLSDDENEETEEMFTYQQIQSCLSSVRMNKVLSRFNLFDEVDKLKAKLGDIARNQSEALKLLKSLTTMTKLVSYEESYKKDKDEILSGLSDILIQMMSPESSLYNVKFLSRDDHQLIITRDDLSKAIALRAWFVDVQHAQSMRERISFLQLLMSQIEPINLLPDPRTIPILSDFPQISQHRDASIQSILEFQKILTSSSDEIQKRENNFLTSVVTIDISNSPERDSHLTFLNTLYAKCKECSLIFPFEEKIAARIDLLKWYADVRGTTDCRLNSSDDNDAYSFVDLENQYNSLQAVRKGLSPTRAKLTKGVKSDSDTDNVVCRFISSNSHPDCEKAINKITQLYVTASSWKKRAEAVIFCLRTHGNVNAGQLLSTSKIPAMVDIKRIVDLIEEYPGLQIKIDGYIERLHRIKSESFRWSQHIYTTLLENDNVSFTDVLPLMMKERDQRPRGIIVNPNRSVVDATIDLLVWYGKIKSAAVVVSERLSHSFTKDNPKAIADTYSKMIENEFYPILADGSEALEIYCGFDNQVHGINGRISVNSKRSLEILQTRFRIRKTSRAPSAEKINAHQLVSSLFLRMNCRDEKEGYPLLLILWFHWHFLVEDFVFRCTSDSKPNIERDQVPSLAYAKRLKAQNPFVLLHVTMIGDPNTRSLVETRSTILIDLDQSIEEAQNSELDIKEVLAKTKDLLRGSLLDNHKEIREHLNNLKLMLSMWKTRSSGNAGLSLNEAYESSLEQHIKYFAWIVRTMQHPVLHKAEASFASSRASKISWHSLLYLHERIPNTISGCGGHILCVLRVRELYDAAKKWQDEVCRSTMISKRGNKRRGGIIDTRNTEKDAKIRMSEIESLAEDPILTKVDMPRHKAVKTMLDISRKFEIQLENFLAQDFAGNQDNAPLPKGDSLLGRKGQFILYRLTGSSLFSMMQTSVQSLAEIGGDVLAETRGKAAFDWMRSAVKWIEDLQHAVVLQAKFTDSNEKILAIPAKNARELCILGEDVFLQTNKDMTKTFSNHGIHVSTNSIKKRLIVKLKKKGAHHSVGGIIIRWCPILFNALRADMSKLELWESRLQKVITDFETFQTSSLIDSVTSDEENLLQWYSYGMLVRRALEEGQKSLVVSPSKDEIDNYVNVLGTITDYLEKNCTRQLNKEFSKRLFANNSSICENRFEFLDALLYRQEAASVEFDENNEQMSQSLDPETTVRDKCRSNIEKALLRAAEAITLESDGMTSVKDLCALKAWEIENEMDELFQRDSETMGVVSGEYREKALSLKSIFENTENISLCLNVLTGHIKANTLVKMKRNELANENVKIEREQAAATTLKGKLLSPAIDYVADSKSESRQKNPSSFPVFCGKPQSILRNKGTLHVLQNDPSLDSEGEIASRGNIRNDVDEDDDGATAIDDYGRDKKLVKSSAKLNSAVQGQAEPSLSYMSPKASPRQRLKPTPPPPSLVGSFSMSANDSNRMSSTTGAPNEDRRMCSGKVFGGKSYRLEIQGQEKYAFFAIFYQEDESQATLNRYMPEFLTQKGRSRIDDFHRFVSEKLRGGRWQATCLRMATISANDDSVYREFFEEYETKERIAMFKLSGASSGGKLFLVTPKFHHIARQSREIQFANKNSTYAVILTKKGDAG